MDVFKQNRYLNGVVILLVVLNLATLTMLWLGRSQGPPPGRPPRPGQNQIQRMLREELAFDEDQVNRYLRLRHELREQVRRIDDEVRQIKKQMFDEVLQDHPQRELSDSLLAMAQEKQAQIEKLTYQHLLNLRNLCKAEQQDKLKQLMGAFFQGQPGNGPGDRLPPPPPGRRPPP